MMELADKDIKAAIINKIHMENEHKYSEKGNRKQKTEPKRHSRFEKYNI